ncbi:MAG: D-tyrosyl-tRNA(Tyr) deacylase [Flavobacteriales bacterium]|nr:D-tyrosyl-tRNA(Tyr) deacylase [Flavobacteriales bacterium]
MKVVIQKVSEASVTIDGKVSGEIGIGLMVLVGIEPTDTQDDTDWICGKIGRLRIFDDEAGVMNLSVNDVDGGILLISQFTLHASTKKGNRPSYIKAAPPSVAIPIYENMIEVLGKEIGKEVKTGIFGADMKVALINDGPVTIVIDSKNKE